jgi:8-oxo-dGTP pyrophosphatase MutT (NUDIX family)
MIDLKSFEKYTKKLSLQLINPLPGENAQQLMASDIRMDELRFAPYSEQTRKSGVLILIYPHNGRIYSVLIQRTVDRSIHSGQISLPGGKYEDVDQNTINTALRETAEEIGIDSTNVHVMGELTKLFIPPSNYMVYPTIGFLWKRPIFTPSKNEVRDIIEYPIDILQDKRIIKKQRFMAKIGLTFTAPYYDINGYVVWGATAMILSEFAAIVKDIEISSCSQHYLRDSFIR